MTEIKLTIKEANSPREFTTRFGEECIRADGKVLIDDVISLAHIPQVMCCLVGVSHQLHFKQWLEAQINHLLEKQWRAKVDSFHHLYAGVSRQLDVYLNAEYDLQPSWVWNRRFADELKTQFHGFTAEGDIDISAVVRGLISRFEPLLDSPKAASKEVNLVDLPTFDIDFQCTAYLHPICATFLDVPVLPDEDMRTLREQLQEEVQNNAELGICKGRRHGDIVVGFFASDFGIKATGNDLTLRGSWQITTKDTP